MSDPRCVLVPLGPVTEPLMVESAEAGDFLVRSKLVGGRIWRFCATRLEAEQYIVDAYAGRLEVWMAGR